MAVFDAARIRALLADDFLGRLESDIDTVVTDTKVGLSQRDLIGLTTKSVYDDYVAGSLSSFDEQTFDYALCALVISQLFFSEFEIVQSIVKATIHQYGDGKLNPASADDIQKMSDWWRNKAEDLIKTYKTPEQVGQPAMAVIKPPVWGSSDDWS